MNRIISALGFGLCASFFYFSCTGFAAVLFLYNGITEIALSDLLIALPVLFLFGFIPPTRAKRITYPYLKFVYDKFSNYADRIQKKINIWKDWAQRCFS
jgi:drug/metabolite transporter (DMT)-like permease